MPSQCPLCQNTWVLKVWFHSRTTKPAACLEGERRSQQNAYYRRKEVEDISSNNKYRAPGTTSAILI